MQLQYIRIPLLVSEAGGDPWQVNATLQSGRPAQISDLAQAFHNAGQCTTESNKAFLEARRRFEAAWNRENGDHPINDSADVQRATRSLGVQTAQLPRVGIDLENIAAALAEAQQSGNSQIAALEAKLRAIDFQIGQDLAMENNLKLPAAERHRLDEQITALENQAIVDTRTTLRQVEQVRDDYTATLQISLTTVRTEGYDPATIQGLDDDGQPTREDQEHQAVDKYNTEQRAKDQSLVDGPGGMTPEKADAAARLRDYTTATNPVADANARRLASERLDDFDTARFTGPLPIDPILGGDARSRAQMRLDWQKKLEQRFAGGPPMTPDQVTAMLDSGEQQARIVVTQQAIKGLENQGLSPQGANAVVGNMSRGVPWSQIAKQQGQTLSLAGAGIQGFAGSASTGRHAIDALTPADAKVIANIGKTLSRAGTTAEVAVAFNDLLHGAPIGATVGKATGGVGGSWLGGMGGGAAAGFLIGPEGAFIGAILGAAVGGFGGEKAGGAVGGLFDK